MPRGTARGWLPPVADGKHEPQELSAETSLSLTHRFNNLPIALTGLIGRKVELDKVRALLAGTSLLTFTGFGGSGKTRLALALAAEIAEEYPDGVCWVDLAGVLDGSLLWSAVGAALNMQEAPSQSFEQVVLDFLVSKHMLLILDNCEHLIYACAEFAERLLSTCPHLKVLTTSREPLAIRGEVVWSVPALSLPEPPFTRAGLLQYDAPRLFIARASAVNPDFVMGEENAEAVGQICQRLDGIPLAIELAAARVKVLSVEQIAARLENRFELLTVGSRTALPRQQTLRSTLDWSFDLLTEAERIFFRRLAVFAAGFTIEAVEYVCADPGARAQVSSYSLVDLMARLVDKSLVLPHQDRQVRYGMLETIRQYALEKLELAQEFGTVSERHFDYFMRLAEQAQAKLISAEQKAALARLDAEHDNLYAAFEWSLAAANPAQPLRLASTLWRYWHIRGHLTEGRSWLEQALMRAESLGRTAERARGLTALGALTWIQGDLALARTELEEAAEIAQDCGASLCLAEALKWLGFLTTIQSQPNQARDLVEKAVQVFQKAGDKWNLAHSLFVLARVHSQLGDLDEAQTLYDLSLKSFRELGDWWGTALPIRHLGTIAEQSGDTATARQLLEESLRLAEEFDSKQLIQYSLYGLGMLAYHAGQNQVAERRFKQSLEVAWQTGLKMKAAEALEALGWVARANHQPVRAARLMAAAGALDPQPISDPFVQEEHGRNLFALRAEMNAEEFNAAWADGEAMTWEQAIEYARQIRVTPSERQAAKGEFGKLSPRERELAILIAEGKSNRQIAETLVVSERTVTTHVANILSKLGFNSRAQVAAWAVQKGLVEKHSKD